MDEEKIKRIKLAMWSMTDAELDAAKRAMEKDLQRRLKLLTPEQGEAFMKRLS